MNQPKLPPLTDYGWEISNNALRVVWDSDVNFKKVEKTVEWYTKGCGCKGAVPTTSVNVEKKTPIVAQVVNAPVAEIVNIQIWIFPLILHLLTFLEQNKKNDPNRILKEASVILRNTVKYYVSEKVKPQELPNIHNYTPAPQRGRGLYCFIIPPLPKGGGGILFYLCPDMG